MVNLVTHSCRCGTQQLRNPHSANALNSAVSSPNQVPQITCGLCGLLLQWAREQDKAATALWYKNREAGKDMFSIAPCILLCLRSAMSQMKNVLLSFMLFMLRLQHRSNAK